MLQLYERCILMDIEFSDTQNVDQLLWKNAFYQVIEKFRQLLKDPQGENAQEIRNKLLQLLDEVRGEKHPQTPRKLWDWWGWLVFRMGWCKWATGILNLLHISVCLWPCSDKEVAQTDDGLVWDVEVQGMFVII